MTDKKVIVVGAGPAGATLAYLMARNGVSVLLLEKYHDFERLFRGEGLQPSGIDAFQQMGLGEKLMQLPKAIVKTMELYQGGRVCVRIPTEQLGFIVCFISQPALLQMLVSEAHQYRSFQIELGATVRDLLREGDRVVGVIADTSAGRREYTAELVVGTDGRHSTLRRHGPFVELTSPQSFDILWLKVPFPDFWPDRTTVRLEFGSGYLTGGIPTSDGQLQTGFTIVKGSYKQLRASGTQVMMEELLPRMSAELAAHLRQHWEAVSRTVLLDVVVGRLTTWTAPGLLLLGDAAHPMSPIGGQGINVALRDALVAANHLCPVLTSGSDLAAIDAAARQVESERMPEIITLQEHQKKQARLFLDSNRAISKLALQLVPFLVRTGLVKLLVGDRLKAFQHGVVPVRLTV
ncbi:MAG: FAD-dependent monooxygenase [Acidobacteriota bacterium]